MANSFSPPRRNAMAPVQPVANVPMAVAPLYSAPTPQDAEVLKRFLLGAAKTTLAGVQFPGDLMHDAARSLRAGRPAGVYADLVETARRVSRDPAAVPGMVVNALKSQAEQARSSPGAMAETMGGMLDVRNMLRRKPTMAELDVYHGTPHTFEPEKGAPLGRFRSSKIGTGEGKQMYGYGLYLSEHPEVASSYKIGLTNPALHFTQELEDVLPSSLKGKAADWADEIQSGKTFGDLLATVRYPWQKTLLQQQKAPVENLIKRQQTGGSLYKVDLPDAKIEQMLDWDRPISQQPAMQKAFNKFWKGLSKNERAQAVFDEFGDYDLAEQMAKNPGEVRGRLAYTLMTHHFGDQAAASDFLRQQGVPGIKYLDAGSRDGGKGTRNFVVFPGEEQNLTILSRD